MSLADELLADLGKIFEMYFFTIFLFFITYHLIHFPTFQKVDIFKLKN